MALLSLYLRHSSFSNPSVASPTSQFILQPFFCFSYVTSSSLNSPGEPPMSVAAFYKGGHDADLHSEFFSSIKKAFRMLKVNYEHCFRIALCFVSSIYCIVMAFLLLLLLLHQCWLISLGMTGQEWRCVQGAGTKWCAALRSERPYNQGFIYNWQEFLSCRRCFKDGWSKEGGLLTSA